MSEPSNVFQQKGQHVKTGNLTFLTTQVTQWETTYQNYSTLAAPTRAMAGCLLSTWCLDHNW